MWVNKDDPHTCLQDDTFEIGKYDFGTWEMSSPWFQQETMASEHKTYGMATYMTTPHS